MMYILFIAIFNVVVCALALAKHVQTVYRDEYVSVGGQKWICYKSLWIIWGIEQLYEVEYGWYIIRRCLDDLDNDLHYSGGVQVPIGVPISLGTYTLLRAKMEIDGQYEAYWCERSFCELCGGEELVITRTTDGSTWGDCSCEPVVYRRLTSTT
jgi:hypothetical protein